MILIMVAILGLGMDPVLDRWRKNSFRAQPRVAIRIHFVSGTSSANSCIAKWYYTLWLVGVLAGQLGRSSPLTRGRDRRDCQQLSF